jgi:hypothetical protein
VLDLPRGGVGYDGIVLGRKGSAVIVQPIPDDMIEFNGKF